MMMSGQHGDVMMMSGQHGDVMMMSVQHGDVMMMSYMKWYYSTSYQPARGVVGTQGSLQSQFGPVLQGVGQ